MLLAVPVSYLFFAPFFLAERFGLSFWQCYALGVALLVAGYVIHRALTGPI